MSRREQLTENSAMIETRLGPVEVQQVGHGPAVVVLHGALGGYDRGRVYSLPDAGYRFICPSRPGYLRTPLSVAKTTEDQRLLVAGTDEPAAMEGYP